MEYDGRICVFCEGNEGCMVYIPGLRSMVGDGGGLGYLDDLHGGCMDVWMCSVWM